MLFKIFLGSRILFVGKDYFLEVVGLLVLEGLFWKGFFRGFCGYGSFVGINDVLKNIIFFGKFSSW